MAEQYSEYPFYKEKVFPADKTFTVKHRIGTFTAKVFLVSHGYDVVFLNEWDEVDPQDWVEPELERGRDLADIKRLAGMVAEYFTTANIVGVHIRVILALGAEETLFRPILPYLAEYVLRNLPHFHNLVRLAVPVSSYLDDEDGGEDYLSSFLDRGIRIEPHMWFSTPKGLALSVAAVEKTMAIFPNCGSPSFIFVLWRSSLWSSTTTTNDGYVAWDHILYTLAQVYDKAALYGSVPTIHFRPYRPYDGEDSVGGYHVYQHNLDRALTYVKNRFPVDIGPTTYYCWTGNKNMETVCE